MIIPIICVLVLAAPGEATAEQRAAAVAFLNEGNERYESGDYTAALARYHLAFNLLPNPRLYFNMAKTSAKLGRHVDSARYFGRFVAESGLPADSPLIREAMEAQAELERRLGALVLEGITPGLTVLLDGVVVEIQTQTATIVVLPGRHRIHVDGPERWSEDREFAVSAGERLRIPLPAAPRMKPGVEVPLSRTATVAQLELAPPATYSPQLTHVEEVASPTPLWGRWWFWAAVAGAAAGSVVAALMVRGQNDPINPSLGVTRWQEWLR